MPASLPREPKPEDCTLWMFGSESGVQQARERLAERMMDLLVDARVDTDTQAGVAESLRCLLEDAEKAVRRRAKDQAKKKKVRSA